FYRPDHETTLENAASLTHALLQMLRLAVPEMWLITRAALCCDATDSEISPSQACLWGAANAIAAELPEQFYAAIDLADLTRPGITAQEAGHIVALLANAALMRSFDQVALRADGARYPRLEARPTPVGTLLPLNSDASYLVSGAFGGLGLVVCDWLVQRGARHLVLVSRSGPTRPEAQQALQRWQAQAVQVHLLHADVADQAALLAGWQTIAATLPPLKGVFHLAGISGEPTPGEQLTLAALQQVLAPKLAGTLNLLALSADAKLDYLVLFSSIASVWGSARQAAYCAANQCIDSLAAALLAQGARVCAINWGPWAEVGMGRVLDQGDQMARIGIQGFSNHDALIWLETMMSNQAHLPQALAVQANWNQFVPLFASRRHNSLLQALPTVASNDGGSASQAALRSALLANPRHQWRAQLLDALGRIVRKICQLDSNHGLPATQGFTELGIDSLMAVELKDQLQKELGLKLAATISFDYPTMDAMVRYLEQRLADEVTPAQTGQAPPVSASAGQAAPAASSVQAIEDMSEDEAEALLMAKLQSL
ncbi:MAG: hypothetical protein RL748_3697, partial [Pseudomonadota bacterium]